MSLELPCKPERAKRRSEAKRLRMGRAPDTGSIIKAVRPVPDVGPGAMRQFFLTFVNEDIPCNTDSSHGSNLSGSSSQAAVRPLTGVRRRLTCKMGPYGLAVPRRHGTKTKPSSIWHLFSSTCLAAQDQHGIDDKTAVVFQQPFWDPTG